MRKEGRWRDEGQDRDTSKGDGRREKKKEGGKKNSERRALVSGKKRAEPHYTQTGLVREQNRGRKFRLRR